MKNLLVKPVCALLALATLAASASAQTSELKIFGRKQPLVGINTAWLNGNFYNCLGTSPVYPAWGVSYDQNHVEATFDDLARMNVNVVRLWMFQFGQGLQFDANGYVSGVEPQFLTNLDDFMNRAYRHGISVYLTCFSQEQTNYRGDKLFGTTAPGGGVVKNFFAPGTARDRVINNAVKVIADRYKDSPALFGYDIMNEGSFTIYNGWVNQTTLRSLIQQTATAIHSMDPDAQVSASLAQWKWDDQNENNAWYGGIGLDFYDYHLYSDNPAVTKKPSWLDKPMILGEFGPAYPDDDWTEDEMYNSTYAIYAQLRPQGYAGSLAWEYYDYDGAPDSIALTEGGNQDWKKSGFLVQSKANSIVPRRLSQRIFYNALYPTWTYNASADVQVDPASTDNLNGTQKNLKISLAHGASVTFSGPGHAMTYGAKQLHLGVYNWQPSARRLKLNMTDGYGNPTGDTVTMLVPGHQWKYFNVALSTLGSPYSFRGLTLTQGTSGASPDAFSFNSIVLQ